MFAARILIPSVFVGLGLERLLVGAGVLAGAPLSIGALAFGGVELVAGLLVMVGWKVRWVAGLLALFIVVDAVLSHAFWASPPAEQHGHLLHFLKNLSMLGGLVLLIWVDSTRPHRASTKSSGAR
jgi:putative oxidoreductase